MFMFASMQEKTYDFHGTLEQFLSALLVEYERLRSTYGSDYFVLDFGGTSSDSATKYMRERKLIFLGDRLQPGLQVKIVEFFNLPSLDGENLKLRVNIYEEAQYSQGQASLSRWKEIEERWMNYGLISERKQPQPRLPKKPAASRPGRSYHSIVGMLETIAYRDDFLKNYGFVPPWSHKREGQIDKNTANLIDKDLGGALKRQWNDSSISGEVLAQLIIEKYEKFTNMASDWDRIKKYDFDEMRKNHDKLID